MSNIRIWVKSLIQLNKYKKQFKSLIQSNRYNWGQITYIRLMSNPRPWSKYQISNVKYTHCSLFYHNSPLFSLINILSNVSHIIWPWQHKYPNVLWFSKEIFQGSIFEKTSKCKIKIHKFLSNLISSLSKHIIKPRNLLKS